MAILAMLVLLLSTSGFKIYSHHCGQSDETTYSLFVLVESCVCNSSGADLCSCCSTDNSEKCASGCEEGCCQNEEQFSKLEVKTPFYTSGFNFEASQLVLFVSPLSDIIEDFTAAENNVLWQLVSEPPPPLPLSSFLSKIQVYLN